MTPVYQTRHSPPNGNCMAACIATLLDKRIEDVDVDVPSCDGSLKALLTEIEEKAKCKVYGFPYRAIVDGVVKSSERYCIVTVRSCVFNTHPSRSSGTWHSVVCEIADDGKLSLVFNPDRTDQRTRSLEQFEEMENLFIVKRNIGS